LPTASSWGRGSWDDKGNPLRDAGGRRGDGPESGFRPKRDDLFRRSGHDEETAGTAGAKSIAALLALARASGLDFVVDEGLLIVEGKPDQRGPRQAGGFESASPKRVYATLVLNAHATPGHSSMPPARYRRSAMMSAAGWRGWKTIGCRCRSAARSPKMFDHAGARDDRLQPRGRLSNLWLFKPLLFARIRKERPPARRRFVPPTALTIFNARRQGTMVLPGNAEATVKLPPDPGRHAGKA